VSRTIASNNYTSGLTLTNTGDNPILIESGFTISDAAGNAVDSTAAYAWSIDNLGSLLATASASSGVGLSALDTLTNATGGTISGYSFGVSAGSAGTVINQGAISQTGTTTPGYQFTGAGPSISEAGVYLAGGLVTNLGGMITATAIGVAIAGGGSVTNSGTISSASEFGVFLNVGGQITNETGGKLFGGRYGVTSDGQFEVTNQIGATITATNDAIINIAGTSTIINQGTITGGQYGINLQKATGTVVNQGYVFGGGIGAVGLFDGGYMQNQLGATLNGDFFGVNINGGTGTVVNQGFIESRSTYNAYQADVKGYTAAGGGVLLNDGGSVTNTSGATISGGFYGVYVQNAAGTVINGGNIESSAGVHYYSSATLGRGAGVALVRGGSLTNASTGTITGQWVGAQLGTFPRYGGSRVQEPLASTFVNYGTIDASNGTQAGAALWLSGPATIINYANAVIQGATNGTISGGPLNGFVAGPFGIVAYYDTTLINRGSVGGTAFSFDASNKTVAIGNQIALTPGATFASEVLATYSVLNATLSSLELMSGTSVGTISGFGTKYVNFADVIIDNGARWALGGTVSGATTFAAGSVVSGQTLAANTVVAGTTLTFAAGGTGSLTLENPSQMYGTIAQFGAGDTLSLAGLTTTTGVSPLPMASNDQLTLNGTGLVLQFDSSVTGKTFFEAVSGNETDITISCFAAGTAIQTPEGPLPVETLTLGRHVMTHRGDSAKIVWIGKRTIDCRRHPNPDSVRPVSVAANAFGPGLPSRDLLLSPDHAVFIQDVLIPIRYLINDETIGQIAVRKVTYYHIELPAHDVILAEDLPVESYLNTGDRSDFNNSGGAMRLFPDFAAPPANVAAQWEARGFAPLVTYGRELAAVRRHVDERAADVHRHFRPPCRDAWAEPKHRPV